MHAQTVWVALGVALLLGVPPLGHVAGIGTLHDPVGSRHYDALAGLPGLAAPALPSNATAQPTLGWTHLSPGAAHGPGRRTAYAIGFVPTFGGVVLFGGWDGHSYLGDTWLFRNGTWSLIESNGPPPRAHAAMAFDDAIGGLVLFGGSSTAANVTTYFGDTWNLSSSGWVQLHLVSVSHPQNRASAAMAFDPEARSLVLIGGTNGAPLADAWTLRGFNWTPFAPARAPPARSGAALAYDESGGDLVLFGGESTSPKYLGDTWRLQNANWTLEPNSSAPPPRADAAFGFDLADGALVLFGGTNGSLLHDTWFLRGGTWLPARPPQSPPSVEEVQFAFDPTGGSMLLYGGWTGTAASNQTWVFRASPNATGWEAALTGPEPWSRSLSSLSFDRATGQDVLFGGKNPFPSGAADTYFGDTWVYGAGRWNAVSSNPAPSARAGAVSAFDPSLGGVVLFGGMNGTTYYNDTWLFRNGSWNPISMLHAPSPRAFAGLAEYPPADGILLFGGATPGLTPGSVAFVQDSWLFHNRVWSPLAAAGTSPSPRDSPQMVFDASSGGVVMFGGLQASPAGTTFALNDTWVFRHLGWTNRTTAVGSAPPARSEGDLVFDPVAAAAVLFGGIAASGRWTDLWEFAGGRWSMACRGCDPTTPTIDPAVFDPGEGAVLALAGYRLTSGDLFGRFASMQAWGPEPFVQATTVPVAGTDVGFPARAVAWWGGGLPPASISWKLPNASWVPGPTAGLLSRSAGNFTFTATISTAGNLTSTGTGILRVHGLPTLRLIAASLSVPVHTPLSISVDVLGGTPPMTASYQNLPNGCGAPAALNLSCRPNAVGAYAINVSVTDAAGATTSTFLQVNVSPPRPVPGPSLLAKWGTVGVIAGVLLVIVGVLAYRRREQIRRERRRAARREALEAMGLPPPGTGTKVPPGALAPKPPPAG
ncbi:MAG: hypothetical protein L3K19_02650 [Thermoplasmata archaeon]|nr:hypothetical protein [Thermoplasmata archaeon]